jgi:hypothetical protein
VSAAEKAPEQTGSGWQAAGNSAWTAMKLTTASIFKPYKKRHTTSG